LSFCVAVDAAIRVNRSLPDIFHAVLDLGKLEAALARPLHTGYGQLLYPTLVGRAAALLHAIASAHAFQDGNKRTAWICTAIYLESAGTPLRDIPEDHAADFVVDLVVGDIGHDGATLWLLDRT